MIEWIHEEVGVGGVAWLGQPPATCPTGSTPAQYTNCRNAAMAKAQGDCTAKVTSVQTQIQAAQAELDFAVATGNDPAPAANKLATLQGQLANLQATCLDVEFFANFNASNCYQYCPGANPPCTDANIIRSVQADLDRPQTGVWTAGDQAALDALGTTFEAFAPDCTGPAPTPTTPGPGPGPAPGPAPAAKKKSGGGAAGLLLLAAAAAAAIALGQG